MLFGRAAKPLHDREFLAHDFFPRFRSRNACCRSARVLGGFLPGGRPRRGIRLGSFGALGAEGFTGLSGKTRRGADIGKLSSKTFSIFAAKRARLNGGGGSWGLGSSANLDFFFSSFILAAPAMASNEWGCIGYNYPRTH